MFAYKLGMRTGAAGAVLAEGGALRVLAWVSGSSASTTHGGVEVAFLPLAPASALPASLSHRFGASDARVVHSLMAATVTTPSQSHG